MSNNGNFTHGVFPTQASGQGWTDYLAGKGFPADYESWGEKEQRHYERGRLRAAGAKLAGYRSAPATEPANIIARTNGLRLVPPARKRDNRVLPGLASPQEWY